MFGHYFINYPTANFLANAKKVPKVPSAHQFGICCVSGEAKNLYGGSSGLGNSNKDTCVKVHFDQEQIFATDVIEKTLK